MSELDSGCLVCCLIQFNWLVNLLYVTCVMVNKAVKKKCSSPVGADRQSAWVILGRLCSDAQLSCAVTIGCSPNA